MPKSIRDILKEYNQKLEESLTFGVSINEDLDDVLNPQAKATKTKVPGLNPKDDETGAASAGRANFLLQNVKNNLRSLGFTVDDMEKQKTIAQLMVAPFGFKFSLIWPKENEWGEKSFVTLIHNGKQIEGSRIDTRAKVKDPNNNGRLILSTKLGPDIIFIEPSELARTLGGGEGKLPPGKKGENYKRLLEEGVTYKIQIDSDLLVNGEGGSEEIENEEPIKEVPIPEEITSGKNRNEIFRLLLRGFGKYNGNVVYGDGFNSIEDAREYSKLQRGLKSGKTTKEELVDFRKNAGRDAYSMMIANLRKSFPNNFLKNLSKAFPEFNIKESENKDKYKRWDIVFPGKVVGSKTIDNLDKNIREFMIAVKKWFAVPVAGFDGKKKGYSISYDEDKVNEYWNNFYGIKNESKLSLSTILKEILKEEKVINPKTPNFPEYLLLKIENGGLQTIDEGKEDIESRIQKSSGEKKEGFIDAILVKAANLFNQKTGKVEGNRLLLKPGYANLGDFATNKEDFADINIEYDDKGYVTRGTIEIKDNPRNINTLLEQIIKSGKMRIKKSDKHTEYIVFYYPSTDIGKKINNTWGEILS